MMQRDPVYGVVLGVVGDVVMHKKPLSDGSPLPGGAWMEALYTDTYYGTQLAKAVSAFQSEVPAGWMFGAVVDEEGRLKHLAENPFFSTCRVVTVHPDWAAFPVIAEEYKPSPLVGPVCVTLLEDPNYEGDTGKQPPLPPGVADNILGMTSSVFALH